MSSRVSKEVARWSNKVNVGPHDSLGLCNGQPTPDPPSRTSVDFFVTRRPLKVNRRVERVPIFDVSYPRHAHESPSSEVPNTRKVSLAHCQERPSDPNGPSSELTVTHQSEGSLFTETAVTPPLHTPRCLCLLVERYKTLLREGNHWIPTILRRSCGTPFILLRY